MRILVKIGGAQLEQAGPRAELAAGLVAARRAGHELVVVHGGGNQIRSLGKRLGIVDRYDSGLRITDAATAEVVVMVLAGSVNRCLTESLNQAGLAAVGICGVDAGFYGARKHCPGGRDLGYVGEVAGVRPALVEHLLAGGYTPVVASVAPLEPGAEGAADQLYNINADQAAAPLARALGAQALLFLTDVPGVLGAEGELCPRLTPFTARELEARGVLHGGMLPKVAAALAGAAALPDGLVKIAPADGASAVLAALEPTVGTAFACS